MKQLKGNAFNITEDLLGRITKSAKSIFNRKDYIYVAHDIKNMPNGYTAVITDVENIDTNKPYVTGIKSLDEFNEGDVVLINPNGEIVFYFERQSRHNAIFVTERCNHRCIMCPQPPVLKEEDKTPFNLKLISLIDKNTLELGITGGEPTLVGDKLFDIIKQIKKCQPKASITLLSNGVKFADRNYALKLAACNCHDLQIDVPIFSDIAEEHNKIVGANTFYKTVEGLYNLATFHIQIGLRIVVHKRTYKRLPQLADYIYHNFPFVSQVAFLQMETTGMADKNIEELWIDPYDYNEELKQAVFILSNRGIPAKIYNAQLCVLPTDLHEYACMSISDWKDTYLPECEGCKLKAQCGGLFESNKNFHSSHIRPDKKFTPMPEPKGDITKATSLFLEKNLTNEVFSNFASPVIYDVPCGYGRHLLWLGAKGYEVYGIDLDTNALDYLKDKISELNISKAEIRCADIECLPDEPCCDIMINVHLYSKLIFERLSSMVKPNGYFIMETPEMRGGNFNSLPLEGEVKKYLITKNFEIIEYIESKPKNGTVAVKVFAKKMA